MSDEWDIKKIKISLGGVDDKNGFLTVELFDNEYLGFYMNKQPDGSAEKFIEEISVDAAKRIAAFLNYALDNSNPIDSKE